jgi:hypothetical protein
MVNINNLTLDTMLTVRQASELTNLTVPTFYTPKRKRDFLFDEAKGGRWLIPVSLLVQHGLLTEDFEPVKREKFYSPPRELEVDGLAEYYKAQFEAEKEKVLILLGENERLKMLAEERQNTINAIVSSLGKGSAAVE